MQYQRVIPILYCTNVATTVDYYKEVFGFDGSWLWGHPPDFGGISCQGVEIFFCEKNQGQPGTWLSLFVSEVDELHERILKHNGKVLLPPTDREWGVREMLVEAPDGHMLRCGSSIRFRQEKKNNRPNFTIAHRKPTVAEEAALIKAVHWGDKIVIDEQQRLDNAAFAVVAELDSQVIGCAIITFDNAQMYYIKNVIVLPQYQDYGIGSAMMQALTGWIDKNAVPQASVTLYTGENLRSFYSRFGFSPMYGMIRKMP